MDEDDPGVALLALTDAYERTGMDRRAAQRRVFAEHPLVVQAWHRGELIPRPPRPRLPGSGGMRRLASGDERLLRPGETLLHKLADPVSGGGFFAIAA